MTKINTETERQHRQDLEELAENIKNCNEAPNMLAQASYARKAMVLLPRIMEHQEARFEHIYLQLLQLDKARGGR